MAVTAAEGGTGVGAAPAVPLPAEDDDAAPWFDNNEASIFT